MFEQADGGTLLIDEIGDLDPSLQPKLLRALERSEIRRVGGNGFVPVDVRVLSATRRDLDAEVQAERFRDDLFHRLVVARVELPPLRRRKGDIGVLARHFAKAIGGAGVALPADVVARWEAHAWPGNVRELRNAVARELALGDLVHGADAADDLESSPPSRAGHAVPARSGLHIETSSMVAEILSARVSLVDARQRVIEAFDRAYLARVLGEHDGNVTRAAAAAGLARRNFQILRRRRGV